jgi:molybdenum cofactor cytidylyltransferase
MGNAETLLPLGGEPLIRRAVREVRRRLRRRPGGAGSSHEAMRAGARGLPVRHAVNTRFASGMGSSFRTAVEQLPDSSAAMIALADQPRSSPRAARSVLEAYRQHGTAIVSVRYGEVMAPPHLFEREFFPELARPSTARATCCCATWSAPRCSPLPPDPLVDIDTPDDYARATSRLSSGR